MFWWVLFILSLLSFIGWAIRCVRNHWCIKVHHIGIITNGIVSVLILICALSFFKIAENELNCLKEKKEFIENNWQSIEEVEAIEDLGLRLEVRDAYFQYDFKLNNIKKSKQKFGLMSVYYNVNITELELNLN